ncbi:MAG: hypothetical protein L0H84_07895 [Pseudonocardia sp.]|nr:hypothetical protein [Pseudonocardia sp.]
MSVIVLAAEGGGIIDWQELTGQSQFVIDVVSFPIFSAIAGLLTNWTGVLMMFAPTRFTGFYVPGLKTLFPFLPRKLQILPTFAPGGILGFQGFIPARAEKMASLMVDKAVSKIGSVHDFYRVLDPDAIAAHVATHGKDLFRPLVDDLISREHPQLWRDMTPRMKEIVYSRVEAKIPEISRTAFARIGDNVDQLVDVKLLAVGHLRRHPELLKDIFYGMGAPELRFMVRSGILGAPMGLLLALYLHVHDSIPIIGLIPHWLVILVAAAFIGIAVNVIAIKVVFTPGEPQPRYKYLWKHAKLAKRQPQAAADLGHAFAYQVITMPNVTRELVRGPRGDRTSVLIQDVLSKEVAGIMGPLSSISRAIVGSSEFEKIQSGAGTAVLEVAPDVVQEATFSKRQAEKIHDFCAEKLRALPPGQFMDMLYSAIEQDAWLLYAHGGILGIVVGAAHLVIFGA